MAKGHNPRVVRTRADKVRELLSRAEDLEARVRLSGQQALELLQVLDQVLAELVECESTPTEVRAESARFEAIQRALYARRVYFASIARASLRSERQAAKPGARGWWWRLDEVVAEERSNRRRRAGLGGAIAVIVLAGAWVAYDRLIAPPAHIRQALIRSAFGENLAEYGPAQDFPASLREFELAMELDPTDPAYAVWAGVVHVQMGNVSEADAAFRVADRLYGDRLRFLNMRSAVYTAVGDAQAADADADEAVVLYSDSAQAYIMRAYAAHRAGDLEQAAADLAVARRMAAYADDQVLDAVVADAFARLNMGPAFPDDQPGDLDAPLDF